MAVNIFIGSTARTIISPREIFFSDNFQIIHSTPEFVPTLCATMNSTFNQLVLNVEGRANFGAGVLEVQTYEIASLTIVNPKLLPNFDSTLFESSNWDVLRPSEERIQIDTMIFDILGLTSYERDAVYESVVELVENRRRRARSV